MVMLNIIYIIYIIIIYKHTFTYCPCCIFFVSFILTRYISFDYRTQIAHCFILIILNSYLFLILYRFEDCAYFCFVKCKETYS